MRSLATGIFERNFKNRYPDNLARIEVIKMPYFACSTNILSVNASPLINKEIVKTYTASSAIPIICFQLAPLGSESTPALTIIKVKRSIPINFQTINAVATPKKRD